MTKKQKKDQDWAFIDFSKLASAKLKTEGLKIVRGRDRDALFIIFNDDSIISVRISKDGKTIWGSTTMKQFQQEKTFAETMEIV